MTQAYGGVIDSKYLCHLSCSLHSGNSFNPDNLFISGHIVKHGLHMLSTSFKNSIHYWERTDATQKNLCCSDACAQDHSVWKTLVSWLSE